jgi:hypothetical protein
MASQPWTSQRMAPGSQQSAHQARRLASKRCAAARICSNTATSAAAHAAEASQPAALSPQTTPRPFSQLSDSRRCATGGAVVDGRAAHALGGLGAGAAAADRQQPGARRRCAVLHPLQPQQPPGAAPTQLRHCGTLPAGEQPLLQPARALPPQTPSPSTHWQTSPPSLSQNLPCQDAIPAPAPTPVLPSLSPCRS